MTEQEAAQTEPKTKPQKPTARLPSENQSLRDEQAESHGETIRAIKYSSISRPAKAGEASFALAPAGVATEQRLALEDMAEAVKKKGFESVDDYVSKKLGWTTEQLHSRLNGEQVDGVALGIFNVERGTALINQDDTGLGKGRQAAAMMVYARNNGMIPVLFTESGNLYNDMVRDLKDIESLEHMFVMESNPDEDLPKTFADAGLKYESVEYRKRMQNAVAKGNAIDQFEQQYKGGIMTKYTQFSRMGPKRDMMEKLSENKKLLFIMDEAHRVTGERRRKDGAYTTAGFIEKLTYGKPSYYSSATAAKRPENLVLYQNSGIGQSIVGHEPDIVARVMKRGVTAVQAFVAQGLARGGYTIQRVKDMDKVDTKTKTLPEDQQYNAKKLIDDFSRVMSLAVDNVLEAESYAKRLTSEETGKLKWRTSLRRGDVNTIIDQMYLALRADMAVSDAINDHAN